ncbi:MAG: YidC/Oxa1 family membrane protein insertase, partial [Acidimicrobiia bacterium]
MGLGEVWGGFLSGLGQLLAFLYDLVPSYGIAIILLTIFVRLLMLPLTVKQTRSMQALTKLQPEVKKIQAKHKGDRQKTNEEVMKLYQEAGANPLGGCWPMLLQMPVYFALYRLFVDCGRFITKAGKRICAPGFIGVKYLPQGSALHAAMIGGHAGFLGMDLGLTPTQVYRAQGIIPAIPYG